MLVITALFHCSPLLQVVVRGVQAESSTVCELWRGLCGVTSLPFAA